jgi:hypothetical protein
MVDEKITPHKVTKPIQLLAAWLVGLCVVNGSFLGAAITISITWLQAILVIAAALNVPLFIAAMFLLQTKFRPEMQEDVFYAKYLDRKTNQLIEISNVDRNKTRLERIESELLTITDSVRALPAGQQESTEIREPESQSSFPFGIAINDHLPWFSDVRKELRNAKFLVADIFGSVNGTKPPEKFIISIGRHLRGTALRDLLCVLLKYNFDGIEFSDTSDQPDPRDVYIGGYGWDPGYATISKELRKFVNGEVDALDIQHYVRTHKLREDQ